MTSPPNEDKSESNISDVNFEHLMSLLNAEKKRTRLHNQPTNSWLKKRCLTNTSIKYLYFPEELIQHENIKEIFQSFDRDNSHSLDILELVKMFRQFNINITKDDLKKLFDVMDEDKDNALNFSEFKNCTLSDRGQQIFNRIMQKVRKENEKRPTSEKSIYLPMSFSAMITFISYKSMRKDVLDQVNNLNLDVDKRAAHFSNLLTLQNLYKSDLKSDNTNKLKEKIMLKNSPISQMKVEPLLRQLSTMKDFSFNQESPFFKKSGEIPSFLNTRKSIFMENTEKNPSHLRKSIEKLQKTIRKSSGISLHLNQILIENKDENNKKEEIGDELENIKKDAQTKGKIQAKHLFKNEEHEKPSVSNKFSVDYKDEEKPILKKPLIPLKLKMMQKIMQENIKAVEKSEENRKFRKLLGLKETEKKANKMLKLKRVPRGIKETKSMDYHKFEKNDDLLTKIKEVNQKAFDSILPKISEIKRMENLQKKEQKIEKLPSLKSQI